MPNDVCSHVKVVVRVRPENESERRENYQNVVQVVDNHMLIFDPKQEDESCFGSQRVRNRNITKKANKDLKFVFDHVFNENSTQVDIFENTTKAVLDGLMNGFNCTGNKNKWKTIVYITTAITTSNVLHLCCSTIFAPRDECKYFLFTSLYLFGSLCEAF